nr:VOC family protein [Pseudomonadota bacterium]
LLRWRIGLRDDGSRAAGGAVPLLIEWGQAHPCDALADSGVTLERVELNGVSAAFAARTGVDAKSMHREPESPLAAILNTSRGRVELASLPRQETGGRAAPREPVAGR